MTDMAFNFNEHPHRRYNPLSGEYVLVSPQRTKRPWLGQMEKGVPSSRPQYDPECYLCPGNGRASGEINPDYASTLVFENDFAALLADTPANGSGVDQLMQAQSVKGTCRVICYSPRHDLTLSEMTPEAIKGVIDVWSSQYEELGRQYRWVQVFENKGAVMGCSNPHPHGQIWASDFLPNELLKEERQQKYYYTENKSVLLLDYLTLEKKEKTRIIYENQDWLGVVPFWAVWPFEILLIPKQHFLRLPDLSGTKRRSLAEALKSILVRYDNLFETEFPYSMGWHAAPFEEGNHSHWQLHAHFYPPLLRSATVKKFMVGYEMLAEPQRDITAEQAAERLNSLSEIHYKAST